MVIPSTEMIAVLFLGILLGGIIFSSNFRVKFFKGLRKFLAGLSSGARNHSTQYQGSKSRKSIEESHPEVEHRYVQTHHLVNCEGCGGSGEITRKVPAMLDRSLVKNKIEQCPECKGKGKVYD